MDDVFARYQAALRSGHQLAAEGKYRDALTQYEEAAGVANERVLPHIGIGGMQLRLGRPREALAEYDRALELEPDNLDALSGRAAALLAVGRRSEAAAAQERIASLREGPRAVSAAAAASQSPISRAETMAIAGEQAHDAGDAQAAISAWLAEAAEHATEGSYDAALDAALRALALDTGAPRSHLELARIYAQRGWHDKAAEHLASLRRLLQLAPDAEIRAAVDALDADLLAMTSRQAAPPAHG